MEFYTLIFIGLAVYRISLFADDPRFLKKLKKIHESFASAAFASLWISAILLPLDLYFHDSLVFKASIGIFALSGLACVLSQLRSKPQFILPLPKLTPPGDKPRRVPMGQVDPMP